MGTDTVDVGISPTEYIIRLRCGPIARQRRAAIRISLWATLARDKAGLLPRVEGAGRAEQEARAKVQPRSRRERRDSLHVL
jgi:hypothetical protein